MHGEKEKEELISDASFLKEDLELLSLSAFHLFGKTGENFPEKKQYNFSTNLVRESVCTI